jgi:hypothetical protein
MMSKGLQNRFAYAMERFAKSQVRIHSGADQRGVRERADDAFSPALGTIGHQGGHANIGTSASEQQQALEPGE